MQQRYDELVQRLNQYGHEYYTLDNPSITDEEYDMLYDELLDLESSRQIIISSISPTHRVGGTLLKGFQKKDHTTALYSLKKAQSFEEVTKFLLDIYKVASTEHVKFVLEQKIDGLAIILRYEKGEFIEARTRGNGKIGEIITAQIKTIKSIPLSIPYQKTIEVQGEVFFPLDKFKLFNETQEEMVEKIILRLPKKPTKEEIEEIREKYILKNPRNGASGALRNLDPQVTATRPLDAFLYNIPFMEESTLQTQSEMMAFLKEQGFKVNPYFEAFYSIEEVTKLLENMKDIRFTLNWDIDGMVIKVDDLHLRDELGHTQKHPRSAIAYKFDAVEKETTLLEIINDIGRTGKLTPVAVFKPISFDGVTVSRATLNNYDDIKRKGIHCNSHIIVRRSNDVIPEITRAIEHTGEGEIYPPTHCPSCHTPLRKELVHLYCPNTKGCPAQNINKFIHFASRNAMNIEGLSTKTIEQLFEAKLISSLTDLYSLQLRELLNLERFGQRKAEKLLEAIEQSKTRPLSAFLYGLGIRHVGLDKVEKVLAHISSLNDLMQTSIDTLLEIDNMGEKTSYSLYYYFKDPENQLLIQRFQELGLSLSHKVVEPTDSAFESLTFVITGKLSKPRKEIAEYIKGKGGKVSSSISKSTNFLVAGDEAGSKLTKAEQLDVSILSENELYEM